jgi:GT2 family glycosyltransferase
MAAYRSALATVGAFDERLGPGSRFPAAEDNDLGFRLLEAGFRIIYEPRAIVYHRAWRPRRDYLKVRWLYGRGKGGFYGKHRDRPDRHITRRARHDVGHRLRRLPARVLREPLGAAGDLLYIAGVCRGWWEWSRLCDAVQRTERS